MLRRQCWNFTKKNQTNSIARTIRNKDKNSQLISRQHYQQQRGNHHHYNVNHENTNSIVISSKKFGPFKQQQFYGYQSGAKGIAIPTLSVFAPTFAETIQLYIIRHRRSQGHHHQQQQAKEDNSTILSCSAYIHENERKWFKRFAKYILNLVKTIWDAIMVTIRTSEIAIRFTPLLLLTPATIFMSSYYKSTTTSTTLTDKDQQNSNKIGEVTANFMSDLTWKYVLHTIQQLGPVFIKMSQWAATRRDIFPEVVCTRLSTLHDAAYVHSWEHTHRILSKSFGEDYTINKGLQIDKNDDDDGNTTIIGSGSVAQVHLGTLEDPLSGERKRVAVKVLHPRIHERVERDLLLMKQVADLIDKLPFEIIKMLSLPRATENFSSIMREQVDLRIEGNNLTKFRDNFSLGTNSDDNQSSPSFPSSIISFFLSSNSTTKETPSKVSFPQPLLIGEDCLVEDLIVDARPITSFLSDTSKEGMEIRRTIAGPLLRAFLKMVFMDNFIHCDLHPGNVLVQKHHKKKKSETSTNLLLSFSNWCNSVLSDDGKNEKENNEEEGSNEYTVVFLDAGIVTSLEKKDQKNLKDLFKAVITNNGELAGRLMVERARYERCSEIPGGVESFSREVADIVSEFHDRRKQGLTLGVVRIGSLLSRVLDLCREHGVEIDPAMANVVMSTLVLEGLGRSLDSNMNLIDCALPFVLGRGKV